MAKSVKKRKFLKFFCISALILLVSFVSIGAGSYYILTADATLDKTKLGTIKPAVSILDSSGNCINFAYGSTDTSEIPEHTKNAFIAKEDKRFYSHSGVDIIRIMGALKNNILNGEVVEGGSTITQQLIKNTQLTPDKTIKRKLKEVKLARELEKSYSKEEILDTYLNTIYFGNNLFGIRSASSFYFKKEVKDLTIGESAILSGIISAPSVYNPVSDIITSRKKATMVVNLMYQEGYINEAEKSSALTEIENYEVKTPEEVVTIYTSAVSQIVCEILGLDTLPSNRNIIIKTYMDYDLQKAMDKMAKSEVYKANDVGSTMSDIASIVVDNKTGGILAFSGNSKYNLLDLKRQPASTIKPILVYGPAIEENKISPASFILDEPININGYTPSNATKKTYGWTTVRDNIVRSTNIPAVKILNETGIEKSKNFAKNLGIEFDPEDNNLAIALGGFNSGVTINSLAEAYSALARGGKHLKNSFVDEIIIDGNRVYKNNPSATQVMKESTAYLLTDMLKSVASYGTGRNIKSLNIPIASKTGTNAINDINHDGWNASYTTEHTAICWMGNTGPVSEVSSSQFNGSLYPTYFVRDIFAYLYSDHTPADFSMPNSVRVVKLDKNSYLNHTLFEANGTTTEYVTEVFAKDNLPPQMDPMLEQIDLLEELSIKNNQPESVIDYTRFIKKYGIW